ncbi:MAG: hypothetical protein HY664_04925 [Chloroflexi bacterium]|nr:hypothetical protein [Chloroflexota bacterium]
MTYAPRFWLPFVVIALTALAIGFLTVPNAALDDSYITYRYALNLLEGHSFVFNPGDHTLTTTAGGYALLLSVLGFIFGHDFPTISNLLSVFSILLGGLFIYGIAASSSHRVAGLVGAVLFQASPLVLESVGMETATYMAALLGGLYAFKIGRPMAGGIALGAAFTLRPDAVIPVAIVFAFHIFHTRRIPWAPALAAAAVSVPYLLFLMILFGSPFPVTLAAKAAQQGLGFPSFISGGLSAFTEYARVSPFFWLFLLFIAAGMVQIPKNRWAWPLVLWAVVHSVAYFLLNVTFYRWYYVPLMPAVGLLIGLGFELGLNMFRQATASWSRSWARYGVAAALGLAAVSPFVAEGTWMRHMMLGFPDARERYYCEAGRWLQDNTDPKATVGVAEVGIMGYYSERNMVDFLGLTSRKTARALEHDDIFWPIAHFQPDYLVFTGEYPLWNYPIYSDKWFNYTYKLATHIDLSVSKESLERFPSGPTKQGPFVIYQRSRPQLNALEEFRPLQGDFEGRLRLEGFGITAHDILPGDYAAVSLTWNITSPLAEPLDVFVHAVNERGIVVAQADVTVNSPKWPLHHQVQHYAFMRVPLDTPPGNYRLVAGLAKLPTGERLKVVDDGVSIGTSVDVGGLKVLPAPEPASIDVFDLPQRSDYSAGGVRLLGWKLLDQPQAGKGFRLRFTFQKMDQVSNGLAVVIRARDGDGNLLAEGGTPLATEYYPITAWRPGEAIASWLDILVPANAPPKMYLSATLVDRATGLGYPEASLGEVSVERP